MSNLAIVLSIYLLCFPVISNAQDKPKNSSIRFDKVSGHIVISSDAFRKIKNASNLTLIEKSQSLEVRLVGTKDGPSVLGKKILDKTANTIEFKPRFSFHPGSELSVQFDAKVGGRIELKRISIPKISLPATSVVQVYPTRSVLPENLLKLYVHFSAPMQRGQVYDHVKIVEIKSGRTIELPFLELEQELWSRDGKRLTLLFDPGRIKRGLKPREEMGPIFEVGNDYKFIISKDWADANGTSLREGFEKKMTIGPNDASTPALKDWKIVVPKSETLDPLIINFDQTLDSSIAKRSIQVFKSDQRLEFKKVALIQNELGLRLLPDAFWKNGKYEIRIASDLEDLCGNRIGRLFDVDLKNPQGTDVAPARKIEFDIK